MKVIDIDVPCDPRFLQVNRRIKGGHWIKPEVREAMRRVEEEAQRATEASSYVPAKGDEFIVELGFTFGSRRSDIDGPVKRTIDALFAGMRKAHQGDRFASSLNDSRIIKLIVSKSVWRPNDDNGGDKIDGSDAGRCSTGLVARVYLSGIS